MALLSRNILAVFFLGLITLLASSQDMPVFSENSSSTPRVYVADYVETSTGFTMTLAVVDFELQATFPII